MTGIARFLKRHITAAALALGMAYSQIFAYFFSAGGSFDYSNGVWPVIVSVGFTVFFRRFLSEDFSDTRSRVLPLAALLSVFLIVGKESTKLYEIYPLAPLIIIPVVMLTAVLYYLISALWRALGANEHALNRRGPLSRAVERLLCKRYWPLVVFLVILLCWLPSWLANYPGTFTEDTNIQVEEYAAGQISNVFPVLHTIFVGFVVTGVRTATGSIQTGIAVCTVIQMLLLAGIFTYTVGFFVKRGFSPRAVLLVWGGFALSPVVHLFCKDLVRDTLFCGFMLLVGVMSAELLTDTKSFFKKPGKIALYVVAGFVAAAFRNAAIFALVAAFAAACVIMLKNNARRDLPRVAALFAVIFLSFFIWDGPICGSFALERPVNEFVARDKTSELLSVPIQQLVRVCPPYVGYTLSREDTDALLELFPADIVTGRTQYPADRADMPKYYFNYENFHADPMKYIGLWFRLGLRYPAEYLNAFFKLSCEAWYPSSDLDVYADSSGTETSYYKPGVSGGEAATESKIPWLYGLQYRLSTTTEFFRIPLSALLFAPAAMLYILLICLGYLRWRKKGAFAFMVSIAVIVHLGTFLCPVVALRYELLSFFTVPVALALAFNPSALKAPDNP